MAGKIDDSLFSAHEHALENEERCPKCGSVLVIKHSKRGPFKACTAYPGCDFVESLHHNDGHIVKELGIPCPECGNELVLRQGRYGMFIGCSAYPDCQHIEKRDQEPESETLDITCPACCKGKLHEKKSRFGKAFYACDAYPKCKFAVNLKPIKGNCEVCGYPLLLEKKRASGVVEVCADKRCQHKQTQ
ncbi:DNA topoisomerase family protein [Grimontia hollisae]|uniref:DNA topoisomerase family protein n=1 Tax=Grimontia hollisae TaxID=673 RepID=UPI0012AC74D7|nr:topoisomerase DNA-binding C4 zinc finger domain-containing protein [Grimontia hollisae]